MNLTPEQLKVLESIQKEKGTMKKPVEKKKVASIQSLLMLLVVALLAVAKMSEFFHVAIPGMEPLYIDVDRALALLVFVGVAIYFFGISWVGAISLTGIFAGVMYVGHLFQFNLVHLAIIFWLVAFVEELLFRGVLLEWMWKQTNALAALAISTVAYAGLHFQAYGSFNHIAALAFLGFVLGLIYMYLVKWDRVVALSLVTGIHALIVLFAYHLGFLTLG